MFTSPLLLSTLTRLPEPLSPEPRFPFRLPSLFTSRLPSRFVLRSVLRLVLLSVVLLVPRLTSLLDVPLLALEGVDTFLSVDFWCPPLIVCRDELLGFVEACLVEACLFEDCREEDCLEVDAFLLEVLRLDPPLLEELALLDGVLALLADAPPRDAL